MDDKQQTPATQPTASSDSFGGDIWKREPESAPTAPAASEVAPRAAEPPPAAPAVRKEPSAADQAVPPATAPAAPPAATPAMPPAAAPAEPPAAAPAAVPESTPAAQGAPATVLDDQQVLTVGRGIRLVAKVCECESLTVEGHLEATAQARKLLVAKGGTFVGNAEVAEAEVAGVVEGNLTVAKRLTIRASGSVNGTTRYKEIVIEAGGQILGTSQCLLATPASPAATAAPVGNARTG